MASPLIVAFATASTMSANPSPDLLAVTLTDPRGRVAYEWVDADPCQEGVGPPVPMSIVHEKRPYTFLISCTDEGHVELKVMGFVWQPIGPTILVRSVSGAVAELHMEGSQWMADGTRKPLQVDLRPYIPEVH